MRYYPAFLDIAAKPVVVIGGGEVAARKVEVLLACGADVTIVSPEVDPALRALIDAGRVRHIAREYRAGDLAGYKLAIVGTDDRSANDAAAREARRLGVWVNAVDDPPNCDFIMPGVVRRGDLIVAVSTSGGSPAMARKMREELEEFLTEDYALMLTLAAEVRAELRERGVQVEPQVWNASLDGELRVLLAQGRYAEAKDRLVRSLLQPAKEK